MRHTWGGGSCNGAEMRLSRNCKMTGVSLCMCMHASRTHPYGHTCICTNCILSIFQDLNMFWRRPATLRGGSLSINSANFKANPVYPVVYRCTRGCAVLHLLYLFFLSTDSSFFPFLPILLIIVF